MKTTTKLKLKLNILFDLSFVIIVALINGGVYIFSNQKIKSDIAYTLNLSINGGSSYSPSLKDSRSSFYIEYDTATKTINLPKTWYDNSFFSLADLTKYANEIADSTSLEGNIDYLYYRKQLGITVIKMAGTDRETEFKQIQSTSSALLVTTLLALLAIFCLVYILIYLLIKPIEQNNQKEKQFLSDASHELKTPVAIINANAMVIKSQKDSVYVNNIIDESKKLNEMVISLLEISRLDEQMDKQKEAIKTEINLSNIIESVALSFEALAFEKGIDFNYENIEKNIIINGNKQNIEKIAGILIDNAVKYANKTIKITLTNQDNIINFVVQNDGKGIPKEDINKIFDRFYIIDKSRSQEKKSFGLGLSMAKELCEFNKIKIKCESEIEKYTRFTVTF